MGRYYNVAPPGADWNPIDAGVEYNTNERGTEPDNDRRRVDPMAKPGRPGALCSAPLPGLVGPGGGVPHRTQGQEPGRSRDQVRPGGCAASAAPAGEVAGGGQFVPCTPGPALRGRPVAGRGAGLFICRDGIWRSDARRDPAPPAIERRGSAGVAASGPGRSHLSAPTPAGPQPVEAVELSGGRRSAKTRHRHDSAGRPGSWNIHRGRCLEPGRDTGRGPHGATANLDRPTIR